MRPRKIFRGAVGPRGPGRPIILAGIGNDMDRVPLRAMGGDIIPRHGRVTRGQTRVIDPAAHVITRAWTDAHGGTRIPRLTEDYEPALKAVERARANNDPNLPALEAALDRHECPATFCNRYDPDAAQDPLEHEDAQQLCQRLPGTEGQNGSGLYRSAVLPWQKAVAQYCWGSRRSLLLEAGTGTGKTVVAAYALQLMQLIDQGQGHFLGGDSRTTNIALMIMANKTAGNADELSDKVFEKLAERAAAADVAAIRDGRTPAVGSKGNLPVTNVLDDPLGAMKLKGFADGAPGRLFFSVYPENPNRAWVGDAKKWDWFVNSVQSRFLILDEVQDAPLVLFLALLEARKRSSDAHAANSKTEVSSPTVLMMSATPCAGGVLHFANMLQCLDNNDSGVTIDQTVAWPGVARTTASDLVLAKKTLGPANVLPLLRELGLTLRSIVQVNDEVVLAAGADRRFRVVVKKWDPESGLEMVELDPMSGQAAAGAGLWWPALLCMRADPTARSSDATLWFGKTTHELAVTEATATGVGQKPMATDHVECSHCDVVAVPTPETLWAHSSQKAQALAIVWDVAGGRESPLLARLRRRLRAMPQEAADRARAQLDRELQAVLGALQDAELAEQLRQALQQAPQADLPEPGFVTGTEQYFLGHAAFAELDKTHLFPSALFGLVTADTLGEKPPLPTQATAWLATTFPDADLAGVAASPAFQTIAALLWGTPEDRGPWSRLAATLKVGGNLDGGLGALQDWDRFNSNCRAWLPWALPLIYGAMYTAHRRGLPPLFYCFLVGGSTSGHFHAQRPGAKLENDMPGRAAAYQMYGNARMFPKGRAAWPRWARGALLVVMRALNQESGGASNFSWFDVLAGQDDQLTGAMMQVLYAFYPKLRIVREAVSTRERSVVYVSTPMRFVAYAGLALVEAALDTTSVVPTPREDKVFYRQGASAAIQTFVESFGDGRSAALDLGAIEALEWQVTQRWSETTKLATGRQCVVICDLAGAVGHDFANYDFMAVTSPPTSQDDLTQLLGRIRRFQGLCDTGLRPRTCHYLVVCDADGTDTRDLSAFKTLAKPVSAAQLHAGSTGGAGRITAPVTAWDVIQRAAREAGPPATDEVDSFSALDFASHALKSRDAVAYLKLTLATYSWKNVVASSAHDFGVIGPRDLDLAVAGDAVYYECLAESLDADTQRCLTNVMALSQVPVQGGVGTFLPARGASHYLSVRVLTQAANDQQQAVARAALEQLIGNPSPTVRYVMLGDGAAPPGNGAFPAADESTVLRQMLLGDETAQLPYLTSEARRAVVWLGQILRTLADGRGSSLLTEENAERRACGLTTLANGQAKFNGKLQRVDERRFLPGVELVRPRARPVNTTDDPLFQRLQRVARGDLEPQAVWFWACRRALESSAVARALLLAIEAQLGPDDGDNAAQQQQQAGPAAVDGMDINERLVNLVDRVVTAAVVVLWSAHDKDLGAFQVVTNGYFGLDPADALLRGLVGDESEPTPDQEREARARTTQAIADGPVACAVFAEAVRAIWLPCRPAETPEALQACCVQAREDAEVPTEEQVLALQPLVDGPRPAGTMRELATGQDVFYPVAVGYDQETWATQLDAWVAAAVGAVSVQLEMVDAEPAYAFPVRSQTGVYEPPPGPPAADGYNSEDSEDNYMALQGLSRARPVQLESQNMDMDTHAARQREQGGAAGEGYDESENPSKKKKPQPSFSRV